MQATPRLVAVRRGLWRPRLGQLAPVVSALARATVEQPVGLGLGDADGEGASEAIYRSLM